TRAVLLSFAEAPSSTILIVLITCMFVAVPVISWVLGSVRHEPWVANVNATLGEIAVASSALALGLKRHLATASRLLTEVERKRDAALEIIRRRQSEQSAEELRLQSELETLRGKEDVALK